MIYGEQDKISLKDVKMELYNVLRFKLLDTDLLNRCITETFTGQYIPKSWYYKEYYKYLHNGYKHIIIDKYDYYTHKNVLLKFN